MLSNKELAEALDSVTTIPPIPYNREGIDFDAHRKNIKYLMDNNHLSENRKRIICIAGTSLINHVSNEEQNRLLEVAAEVMDGEGVLISALVPNPISSTGAQVEIQSKMKRAPDAYLIMPLAGVYSSEGLYQGFMKFAEEHGSKNNARFLFYHRLIRDRDQVIKLMHDSPYFVGLKVGTSVDEVPYLVEKIGDRANVIWGIGDRSTKAAQLGTKGHTSGISNLYVKAGDLINNAQRVGDFATSLAVEKRVTALEDLRFINSREYNYAAVIEGMILSGFDDIDGGIGGPFNPRVPADVSAQVKAAIEGLEDLH